MRIGDYLDRGGDDAKIGGLGELLLKPSPLFVAQHRFRRIVARHIRPQRRAFRSVGHPLEVRSEIARIEQDNLRALSLFAEHRAFVNAGTRFHFVGRSPEGFEDRFRPAAVGEARTAIVEAEVVIVPGDHHRNVCAERGEFGRVRLHPVGFAQRRERGIAAPHLIAVIVVANEQEQLRVGRCDAVPHVLRTRLVIAAAKGKPGDDAFRSKRGIGRRDRQVDRLFKLRIIGCQQLFSGKRDLGRGRRLHMRIRH